MSEEYDGPERRAPDPIQLEIEAAIKLASDPKDRAFLLIMNKMAGNLDENTSLTRTLREELKSHTKAFQAHETREMTEIAKGRGFQKGALMVLGGVTFLLSVLMSLLIWVAMGHIEETKKARMDLDSVIIDVAAHKEHHRQEERYRGDAGQPGS